MLEERLFVCHGNEQLLPIDFTCSRNEKTKKQRRKGARTRRSKEKKERKQKEIRKDDMEHGFFY